MALTTLFGNDPNSRLPAALALAPPVPEAKGKRPRMRYTHGNEALPGDKVAIDGGYRGVVVGVIATRHYGEGLRNWET